MLVAAGSVTADSAVLSVVRGKASVDVTPSKVRLSGGHEMAASRIYVSPRSERFNIRGSLHADDTRTLSDIHGCGALIEWRGALGFVGFYTERQCGGADGAHCKCRSLASGLGDYLQDRPANRYGVSPQGQSKEAEAANL